MSVFLTCWYNNEKIFIIGARQLNQIIKDPSARLANGLPKQNQLRPHRQNACYL